MFGGFSVNEHPLNDVWHLDISKCYDSGKEKKIDVSWKCVRKDRIVKEPEIPSGLHNPPVPPSPYQRFWHTANYVSSTIGGAAMLVYGGMFLNPSVSSPCLNTLHFESHKPASLYSQALCWYAKNTNKLPSVVFPGLFRKHHLLQDIQRFKRDYLNSFGGCSRTGSSIYDMSLKEIFDILHPSYH